MIASTLLGITWARIASSKIESSAVQRQVVTQLPSSGFQVSLNEADAAELSLLPLIGPKLAQRIVDDRDAVGIFVAADSLKRVPGVGPHRIDRAAKLVSVER